MTWRKLRNGSCPATACQMGRPLRHVPYPYAPFEVTIRTIMGMRLLKPSPEVNEIIVGVFARALALYEVRLYELIAFNTHLQYIVGVRDAEALARFMAFVHGNLAKEMGRIFGWRGHLWSRRGRPIPIVDDEALEQRIRYIYKHGVKEGFVTSPLEWPGVASVKARVSGEPLVGYWFNRTAESQARRQGKHFGKYDFATRYELELCPAPCWQHLSEEQYRAKVVSIVKDIEDEAAEAARDGDRFAGLETLAAQDPLEIRPTLKRSPAPLCHASTKESRDQYRKDYYCFAEAFYAAADALVEGILDVVFPEGCFPRPRPFVMPIESLAPS